jgi:hypothetical protein
VTTANQSDSAYKLVVDTLSELGISLSGISRVFLLRDRRLVGQRFLCDGAQALWMTDNRSIDFYNPDGELIKTVAFDPPDEQEAA